MSAAIQSDSGPKVFETDAQPAKNHNTTSNNPLNRSPNNSNLKTDETHQRSAEKFAADSSQHSQWSDSWKTTFPLRAGHFVLGIFGVAAFRAAYIQARGNICEYRVGRMQVRFDPSLSHPGQKPGERTFRQAEIASSSQGWGASLAAPVSLVTAVVGGLCGLCARAHRSYQQRRMQDDNVYQATRDQQIAEAMCQIGLPDPSQRSVEAGNLRGLVIAEAVKRAVDSWRDLNKDDATTPVTKDTLRQEIAHIVNGFRELATVSQEQLDLTTFATFRNLVNQWTQADYQDDCQDGGRPDRQYGLEDQIAGVVEKWAVHRRIRDVCNTLSSSIRQNSDVEPQVAIANTSLQMSWDDFDAAYTAILDQAIQLPERNDDYDPDVAQDSLNADGPIRDHVRLTWQSQPPESLYKIMSTIR